MKLDSYGFIEMEQTGWPGNTGDSAAETGRWITLCAYTGRLVPTKLDPFVTDRGILRHPNSPWREDDTSSDQVSPLLAAAALIDPQLADKIMGHLKSLKTGNGDFVTLGLYAQMRRRAKRKYLWLSDLAVLGQALIFKIPWRWSDSKKTIESNADSSADYLNFVNSLVYSTFHGMPTWPCKLAMKITSKEKVMERVWHYYKPEPNSEWLIMIYEHAIQRLWE